jgi:hypothetical protein
VRQARTALPTDLLAIATYGSGALRNQVWPRERLGLSEQTPGLAFLRDLAPSLVRRRVWVSSEGQRPQGLISARLRGGRQAWEIECFIDRTETQECAHSLLEAALIQAGRCGAEKLFCRVDAASPLLRPLRDEGFTGYRRDLLMTIGACPIAAPGDVSLRPVLPADSYLLYRLYNSVTPEVTRRAEASTFAEWHAAQERAWLRDGIQLIAESGASVSAWLRVARRGASVLAEFLLQPEVVDDAVGLLSQAVRELDSQSVPVFVLLAGEERALASRLEDAGFRVSREFVSLVRRTARPLPMPNKLRPAVAKTAAGV